jgi:mannonate dehydratase
MRERRAFLKAALCAPALGLTSCRLTLEQGLLGECRHGSAHGAARRWIDEAWRGVDATKVWDVHAHLFGNGRSGSGIYVEPDFDRPRTPQGLVRRTFFMNGGCVGDDEDRLDQGMVKRLVHLVEHFPAGAKVMLMAFDFTCDEAGRERRDLTTFAVPNEYARRVAASDPGRFEWVASIHPYREDAIARLEQAAREGARALKWLPPSMGIDLRHRKCVPFYEALRRLRLPLLVHVGEEQAVAGAGRHELANPLFLRAPLEHGVRVVAAHCATLGESPDLEASANPDKAPAVENFQLFARLMGDRRYGELLHGDISAITQVNRARYVPALLDRGEWHPRLLNGSDYPLPGIMPLFSLKNLAAEGLLQAPAAEALKEARHANALLFDFSLKRHLVHRGRRFPASVFETRPFFEG